MEGLEGEIDGNEARGRSDDGKLEWMERLGCMEW